MRIKALLTGTALAALVAGTASAQELNIYAWADELPSEVVADFEAETGITVTVDTFDSNESLVAKLAAGASGYDLIEPSQYAVQILIKQGLIVPLDHSKIPNYGNLPEVFRNAVVLRDMEDFTYDEIARILEVPVGTVMSRIHRGRALLRSALARRSA